MKKPKKGATMRTALMTRTYYRITPPPRHGKAKPRRGPIFTYPKEVQIRTGRILTPIGGLILALAASGGFWAIVAGVIWWLMRGQIGAL